MLTRLLNCLLAASVCLLLLPACGGGGGGNDPAPVITITGLLEGDVVNATRTVHVRIVDNSGIISYDIVESDRTNGLFIPVAVDLLERDVVLDLAVLDVSGPQTFSVFARDNGGHESEVILHYTIDRLPTAELAGVNIDEFVTVARSLLITGRDDLGVQRLDYDLDGVASGFVEPLPGSLEATETFTLDPAQLTAGSHVFRILVTDSLGQTTELLVNFGT